MLKQKQAKLLDKIFQLVGNAKGLKVAEELLQLLLTGDATTRLQLNQFITYYLGSNVYVIKYLNVKNDDTWLINFESNVLEELLKKFDEVKSWKLI